MNNALRDTGVTVMGEPLTREEQKEIYKEALKEWWREQWDAQYERFGKWALHMLAAGIVFVAAYGCMHLAGWELVPGK